MHSIVFVVAEPWHTTDWTTDLGLLVRAFRAQGHEASLTCTQIVGPPADYPTFEATVGEMSDPDYWRQRGPTIAIVFNWLIRAGSVLRALHEAGAFVIQFGDSDGLEGMRVHPQAQITRMWHTQPTLSRKVDGMFTLLRKYLYGHRKEDSLLVQNLETAHFTTLTSEIGRREFLRFLASVGKEELSSQTGVLPSPLAPPFLQLPVLPRRNPSIVAVGRWADPQKDASLMVEVLRLYLKAAPVETAVTLIGSGGERVFAELVQSDTRVQYKGKIPHHAVAEELSQAQILLFTSRWEGVPVVSLEMVALGGTVVGPATLPGIASFAEECCGTVAERTIKGLAAALRQEMDAWKRGERQPRVIAEAWRIRLSPESQAAQIVEWAEKKKR